MVPSGILITNQPLDLLHFGRVLIGIALGIKDVTVNKTTSLWFGKSKWVSMSFMISSTTLEIGSNTARYCM